MSPVLNPSVTLNGDAVRDLVGDINARATALHLVLLAMYGNRLYGDAENEAMDPVEIFQDLEDRFSITVPEENHNKIEAILAAVSTDAFYEQEEMFAGICSSLCWGDPGDAADGMFHSLSMPEILWAIYEVSINRDEHTPRFSAAVEKLVSEIQNAEAQEPDETGMTADQQYQEFVALLREETLEQLEKIGIPRSQIEHELPSPAQILG